MVDGDVRGFVSGFMGDDNEGFRQVEVVDRGRRRDVAAVMKPLGSARGLGEGFDWGQ